MNTDYLARRGVMIELADYGVGDYVFGLIVMVGVQTLVAKLLGSPDLWLERTRS